MSGASTMKNAVKRVTHKERAQPSARSKLGLLEKKKDYKERSYDYHKKQDYLKVLKKKSLERNPDEYYNQMHNSQVIQGKHVKIQDNGLDSDVLKLLKTQDMGYIVHKKSVDSNRIQKLKSNLHMIGSNLDINKGKTNHTIFVDNEDEVESFDAAKHFDTDPDLVDRTFNRPKVAQLEEQAKNGNNNISSKKLKNIIQKNEKSYKELEERTKRAKKLDQAVQGLALQRNLMGKGTKRKIVLDEDGNVVKKKKKSKDEDEDDNDREEDYKVIYKWKRERKR